MKNDRPAMGMNRRLAASDLGTVHLFGLEVEADWGAGRSKQIGRMSAFFWLYHLMHAQFVDKLAVHTIEGKSQVPARRSES